MENKTAVEWLKERLPSLFKDDSGHYKELFQQALIMEKEQTFNAFIEGHNICRCVTDNTDEEEEIFNETYGKDNA